MNLLERLNEEIKRRTLVLRSTSRRLIGGATTVLGRKGSLCCAKSIFSRWPGKPAPFYKSCRDQYRMVRATVNCFNTRSTSNHDQLERAGFLGTAAVGTGFVIR